MSETRIYLDQAATSFPKPEAVAVKMLAAKSTSLLVVQLVMQASGLCSLSPSCS